MVKQRIGAQTGKIGDLKSALGIKILETPRQAAKAREKPPRQRGIMAGAASGEWARRRPRPFSPLHFVIK